jgi:hypothetical protein
MGKQHYWKNLNKNLDVANTRCFYLTFKVDFYKEIVYNLL